MRLELRSLRALAALALFVLCATSSASAGPPPAPVKAQPPKRLALYYGQPSAVNGAAGDVARAVQSFDDYGVVVLGGGVELPQYTGARGQQPDAGCAQNSHRDHDRTRAIIEALQPPRGATQVYGYVTIGGENADRRCTPSGPPAPLTFAQIQARVDAWAALRVTGVFLDHAEFGFGTSRDRQNAVVDYVHQKGLRVFINGFLPDDVFSAAVTDRITYATGSLAGKLSTEPMNIHGLPPKLGAADLYLLEHYQVIQGSFPSQPEWAQRADAAFAHRERYGTQIATVTSQADANPAAASCSALFEQSKFDYAWWSTLLYGFDFMGWGEPDYAEWGTCENTLLPHTPPAIPELGYYTTKVLQPILGSGGSATRRTTLGTLEVDPIRHAGRFLALPPWEESATAPTAP
jgi:hypothetical protein